MANLNTIEFDLQKLIKRVKALEQAQCCNELEVRFSLTAAQILDFPSPTVQILPAPGAGKVIVPLGTVTYYHHGTSSYTTTQIVMKNPSSAGHFNIASLNLLSADRIFTESVTSGVLIPNEPLVATSFGTPAAGDGTVDVILRYRIVKL